MTVSAGDIVEYQDERRVVTDVTGDGDLVLRYTDDDPRRQVDEDGGDLHFNIAREADVIVIGHIQ